MKKTMKQMKTRLAKALVAWLVLTTLGVQAETINYDWNILSTATDWDPDLNPALFTQVVPKFNPALGTLTSVTVNGMSSMTSGGTIYNHASTPQTFYFTFNFGMSVYWSDESGDHSIFDANTLPYSHHYVGVPASSFASPAFSDSDNWNNLTYSGTLSDFIGTGLLTNKVSTATGTGFIGGGGNIDAAVNTTAALHMVMTYNYTPVTPVPDAGSTWVLLLTGLACLPLGLYRRKA